MVEEPQKLKTIAVLQTSDDLIYPFALQAVEDVVLYTHKFHLEIVKLKKDKTIRESRIQLANVKTEKPVDFIKLRLRDKAVFESADWNQKNYIMMNDYLLPSCTAKNIHYLRSRLTVDGSMLAAITTAGIIELYNYDMHNHQIFKLPHDLNQIRDPMAFMDEIKSFKVLERCLNSVSFTCFEWCPTDFKDYKLLLTVTKSEVVSIFKIQTDKASQIFQQVVQGVHMNQIKWTYNTKKGHELYIGCPNGNLRQFSFKIQKDKIQGFKELEEIKGTVKIPPSFIYVDYTGEDPILFCIKNHSIDVFYKRIATSFYVGLSVTGIEKIGYLQYMASSLNNMIYFIELDEDQNYQLKVIKNEPCEINAPLNEEVPEGSTKMSYYGIATSRNKVFIYIACTPYQHTDHLVIKQPALLYVNLLLKNDPSAMLKENGSLSLTNFADCIEAFKMQALANIQHTESIECMDYELVMSLQFLYYLKVQLLTVVNVKLIYYSTRSQRVVDDCQSAHELLIELIQVINTFIYLKKLMKSGKFNELSLRTIQAMKDFLTLYSAKTITAQPYMLASETFKEEIQSLTDECDKIKTPAPPEVCQYCDGIISSHETCDNGHQVKRCAITCLPIAIDTKNYCTKCVASVTTRENLKALFGDSFPFVCPFCDDYLTFEE